MRAFFGLHTGERFQRPEMRSFDCDGFSVYDWGHEVCQACSHGGFTMTTALKGRILYANNRPAENVEVRVFDEDAPGRGDDDLTITPGLSDRDGRFMVVYDPGRFLDDPELAPSGGQAFLTRLRRVFSRQRETGDVDLYLPYLEFRYTYLDKSYRHTTPLLPLVTEYRLPTLFSPISRFRASEHGFRFINNFPGYPLPFELPKLPGAKEVAAYYGLCGGMSSAACDFYYAESPVPSGFKVPERGMPLYQYLYDRQFDTFGAMGHYILRFVEWMALPEDTRNGTCARTLKEFGVVKRRLDARVPVILGLVYVGFGDTARLWDNHQVLAHTCTESAPNVFEIAVYDPNHPGRDDIVIRAEKTTVGNALVLGLPPRFEPVEGLTCVQKVPGRDDQKVRGFFVMPYTPRTPPEL